MTQTTTDPHRIQPAHEVEDDAKLAALVESMSVAGWIGAPVVVIEREGSDPQAITGSHRIAAAREAGIEIPTVDLADLLGPIGVDLTALIAEYEQAGMEWDDAAFAVAARLDDYLSAEVIEHYGLDAH